MENFLAEVLFFVSSYKIKLALAGYNVKCNTMSSVSATVKPTGLSVSDSRQRCPQCQNNCLNHKASIIYIPGCRQRVR